MHHAVVQRVQRTVAACLHRKLAIRRSDRAIVSFTFDDFPRSAWTVGGKLLDEFGLRGTYYTSLGLVGRRTPLGDMCELEDVQSLVRAEHELACHTRDHVLASDMSARDFAANCEQNRRAMAKLIGGYRPRAFSFPEGVITPPAKRMLTSEYDSCRTIEPGINENPADLGFLRANRIYATSPFPKLRELIQENRRKQGWLILYTHDISTAPSAWGCTPEQFRNVVSWVTESGADVLTVGQATDRFLASS